MKSRVLAIGTHPDDIEIGCGGTIRLLADQGYEIKFVVVTSGEEGSLNPDKEKLRSSRKNEANQSASILGASKVIFFDEPDGLTHLPKESKVKLIHIIREFKPEIVFIHSSYDCFPDHQVVSQLSKSAIQAAGGPWYGDAGLIPHHVRNVFGFEVWNPIQSPQMIISIENSIDRKIQALKCHTSQIESVNYIGAVRGLNEYRGAVTMSGRYAEAFEVVKVGSIL
jgi:LmbE family N-acetylglucosaminyl deacetylase